MTPSNPDNQQPLIYRIADAIGVFHLVAPVDHNHPMSEVAGLVAALAAKANAAAVETALAGKANVNHQHAGVSNGNNGWVDVTNNGQTQVVGDQSVMIGIGDNDAATVTLANIANLKRALLDPDSSPTEDSTNLVTSGGVKAALDAKYSINQVDEDDEQEAHLKAIAEDDDVYFKFQLKNGNTEKQVLLTVSKMDNFARAISNPDSAPAASSDNLITSGGVAAALVEKANKDDVEFKVYEKNAASDKINLSTDFAQGQKRATYLIFNYTSDACALSDLFTYQSGEIVTDIVLPATEQPAIQVDGAVVVSVLKYSDDSSINYIIVPECYY